MLRTGMNDEKVTVFSKWQRSRKTWALYLLVLVFFSACTPAKPEKDPQQQHIESMMTILARVQKNLCKIQQKEAVVERLYSGIEGKGSSDVEQIGRDIAASIRFIDSTLVASKKLIKKLEDENQASSYRVASLDRLVSEMKLALNTKDNEVNVLKGNIQKLNTQLSSLLVTVDVLDEYIQDQELQLYTVYYISGTFDELVDRHILLPVNTFEKIFGASYRLAPDFDIKQFKKVDMTETRDLFFDKPLKSLKIVTPHTAGSYELVGGATSSLLLIRDENAFWQKSRCLVIVTEQ